MLTGTSLRESVFLEIDSRYSLVGLPLLTDTTITALGEFNTVLAIIAMFHAIFSFGLGRERDKPTRLVIENLDAQDVAKLRGHLKEFVFGHVTAQFAEMQLLAFTGLAVGESGDKSGAAIERISSISGVDKISGVGDSVERNKAIAILAVFHAIQHSGTRRVVRFRKAFKLVLVHLVWKASHENINFPFVHGDKRVGGIAAERHGFTSVLYSFYNCRFVTFC